MRFLNLAGRPLGHTLCCEQLCGDTNTPLIVEALPTFRHLARPLWTVELAARERLCSRYFARFSARVPLTYSPRSLHSLRKLCRAVTLAAPFAAFAANCRADTSCGQQPPTGREQRHRAPHRHRPQLRDQPVRPPACSSPHPAVPSPCSLTSKAASISTSPVPLSPPVIRPHNSSLPSIPTPQSRVPHSRLHRLAPFLRLQSKPLHSRTPHYYNCRDHRPRL
jgi:hypothetical protein